MNREEGRAEGVLYIVSTPIGNMEDITLRALKVLASVDLIAAEDTRNTGLLLAHHGIRTRLISCHEHNEKDRIPQFIEKIRAGEKIALVSDAGTPLFSDPGYNLVGSVLDAGLPVEPVPGVFAGITALCVSGLPTDSFFFKGFLPKNRARRKAEIERLSRNREPVILYESPLRIRNLLRELTDIMGDREAMLAREMTKPYEEYIRATLSGIDESLENRKAVKGECTLVVMGASDEREDSESAIEAELNTALCRPGAAVSVVSKMIAQKYNVPRKSVYARALALQNQKKGTD